MNLIQLIFLIIIILMLNVIWNSIYTKDHPVNEAISDHATKLDKITLSKESKFFLSGIALIPLLIGFWAVNHWLKEYNIAVSSNNWNTYTGILLSKEVSFHKPVNTTGSQSSGKLYIPTVKYEFTYENQIIEWDVIDLKNRTASGDISRSEAILNQLPDIGNNIDVFFSPEHRKAVLIPGAGDSNYFGIIFGFIFFLVGLIGLKLIFSF